ncbi:DNA helicase [Tanacetum coccineum]
MLANRLLMEERNYNQQELMQERDELVPNLNTEQRKIYDLIIDANVKKQQELIFVYGHGGTGWRLRQTLPEKKGQSNKEVISSYISESELWSNFKVFTLSENMRLTKPNISADERSLISSFASWLLDIGDGKTGEPDPQDPENTSWVDIPINYCIPDNENGLQNLINFIYDQSTLQTPSAVTLQQKAIVCPKNETADTINSKVLEMVQGETKIYLSHDEATPIDNDGAETEMLYPVEHLNTLKLSGFPPHRLELKVGAPVMLLRNFEW